MQTLMLSFFNSNFHKQGYISESYYDIRSCHLRESCRGSLSGPKGGQNAKIGSVDIELLSIKVCVMIDGMFLQERFLANSLQIKIAVTTLTLNSGFQKGFLTKIYLVEKMRQVFKSLCFKFQIKRTKIDRVLLRLTKFNYLR